MPLINVVSVNSFPEQETMEYHKLSQSTPPSDLLIQWDALVSRSKTSAYQITKSIDHIESSRNQLCEWAYVLVDHYNIDRFIVSIAFSMFDRFVVANGTKDLELLAMSCMYTAIKIHSCSGKLPASALARLARSSGGDKRFTVEQIEEMELRICNSLGWYVNPPTHSMFLDVAFDFIEGCARDCPLGLVDGMRDLAVFLVEISVIDIYFATVSPSSVAAGAILVAMDELSAPKAAIKTFEWLEHDHQEARQCVNRLSQHYKNWKMGEEKKKRPDRSQSASPTGVGPIETGAPIVTPRAEEKSSLESAFEAERNVNEVSHSGGSKRKREV